MSYHHDIIFFNPKWCFKPPPGTSQAQKAAGAVATRATTRKSSSFVQKKECLVVLTSPDISCMGQIKPERSSSVTGALMSESAYSSSSSSSSRRGQRTSKVLSITRALFRRRSRSPRASSRVGVDGAGVGVADMDPPLPVVPPGARAVNTVTLWERRRCGGVGLEGLQIQRLQSLEVMLKHSEIF